MVTWTPEQFGAFLDGVRDDRLSAANFLLATTGMRRGEALGLRWIDADLDVGRAAIRQTVITLITSRCSGLPRPRRDDERSVSTRLPWPPS